MSSSRFLLVASRTNCLPKPTQSRPGCKPGFDPSLEFIEWYRAALTYDFDRLPYRPPATQRVQKAKFFSLEAAVVNCKIEPVDGKKNGFRLQAGASAHDAAFPLP